MTHLKRGHRLFRQGKTQQAITAIEKGLESTAEDFGLLLHKSLILNADHQHSEALDTIRTIQSTGQSQSVCSAFEAMILIDNNCHDEAEQLLNKSLENFPSGKLAQSFLLLILLHKKDYPAAKAIIEDIGISDSPYFKLRLYLLIEQQLLADPDTMEPDKIQECLTQTISEIDCLKQSKLWDRGAGAYEDGDNLTALYCFYLGNQREPEDRVFQYCLAESYANLGDNQRSEALHLALQQSRQAQADEQQQPSLLRKIFGFFMRRTEIDYSYEHYYYAKYQIRNNQYAQAIKTLQQLIAENSNNVFCYNDLGCAYIKQGKTEAALEQFRKNLDLDADTFPRELSIYLKRFCELEYKI